MWLHSGNQTKLLLHLVVRTPSVQYVFRCNHQADPHGAFNLAASLVMRDNDMRRMVDLTVYTSVVCTT